MSKRTASWLLALICFSLGTSEAAAQGQPNVIVVLLDDLRFDAIAATGHPFVATPNIDRIANEGIRFQNAFVTTPLCSPSRASFYSGRHARNHGVRGNGQGSSLSDTTLWTWARTLQQQGYHTGHVGKWHMDPTSAPRFGFEYWAGFESQGSHTNIALNVNGVLTPTVGYTTDILTDYAIAFIVSNHGGRPFALSLAYKAVHEPFPSDDSNVPPEFRTLYENETLTRQPNASSGYTLTGKPMLQNPPPPLTPPVPGSTGPSNHLIRNQLRQVTHVDANIGRLFAALTQANILDQTVIIFSSDNGFFWGEHGLSDKRAAYEESIRVPLLMRYPPLITAGSTSQALVAVLDVGPTLMELAGAPIPQDVEGLSLAPVLANPANTVRDRLFFEYWLDSQSPRIASWKALRNAGWKYISYPAFGTSYDELYDLAADPFEMTNRIADPAAMTVRDDMRRSLASVEHSLIHEPVEVAIPGTTLDYEITETGAIRQNSIIATAGSRSVTPAGGRNGVIIFPMPGLAPGHAIVSASPAVEPATSFDRHVPATTHADLWLLKIGSSTPIAAYIESNSDTTPGLVKLDDNVYWWDRDYGEAEIDPDAAALLAQHMMAFYAANPGYSGGSFLSLRYNPDADTGNGDAGWDLITAEHSTPTLRPVLKLKMTSPDTDGDGLSDLREQQLGTNPGNADSDGDGLSDGAENGGGVFVNAALTGTNPLAPDSDGDGASDGLEVGMGTDPNDAQSVPQIPALGLWGAGCAMLLLGLLATYQIRSRGSQVPVRRE